ncbi:hypothetical protein ACKLTP_18235, partial [Paenarthrobacter ureafaciens]
KVHAFILGAPDSRAAVITRVRTPSGTVYGINVSVPAHRMSEELRSDLGGMLRAAAEELQGRLV